MKLSKTQNNLYELIKKLDNNGGDWVSEVDLVELNNYKKIRASTVWALVKSGHIEIQIYSDMVEYNKVYDFGKRVVSCSNPESFFKVRINKSGSKQVEYSHFCSSYILAPKNGVRINKDLKSKYLEWLVKL